MSPAHFKQAPKFGELSLGMRVFTVFPSAPSRSSSLISKGVYPHQKNTHRTCFFVFQTWCKPQLSFISCVAFEVK